MSVELPQNCKYETDKTARAFLILAISYLLAGLLLGTAGGLQYILPAFLKNQLSFQKTRPLHVYLVITWIFTAAQAGLYYYIPRVAGRPLVWKQGALLHFLLQLALSVTIVAFFFAGHFGGREYLEFPPWLGLIIFISWIPLAINFFFTVKPNYKTAPVYIWSWSTGIIFFFITLTESYLWLIDYFGNNVVRDITIQWKALGSMVGSWNMLVYGTAMYIMEEISGDKKTARSPVSFFFYFLGLTNLMFNWGHHTYIVPAAPWVKTVSFAISMTELLILGYIIRNWKKTFGTAVSNHSNIVYRLLSYADGWIFLNLALAIAISVPAWNYFTHGTHITVAHAMGATIGINTMLLFASVFFIVSRTSAYGLWKVKKQAAAGIFISNIALVIFWVSLIGSGVVKIIHKQDNKPFAVMLRNCEPWFRAFAYSGILVFAGLLLLGMAGIRAMKKAS